MPADSDESGSPAGSALGRAATAGLGGAAELISIASLDGGHVAPMAGPTSMASGTAATATTVSIPAPAAARLSGAGFAISRRIRAAVPDPPAFRAPASSGRTGAEGEQRLGDGEPVRRGHGRVIGEELGEPGDLLMRQPERRYARKRRGQRSGDRHEKVVVALLVLALVREHRGYLCLVERLDCLGRQHDRFGQAPRSGL
jgi:hypothetical protein